MDISLRVYTGAARGCARGAAPAVDYAPGAFCVVLRGAVLRCLRRSIRSYFSKQSSCAIFRLTKRFLSSLMLSVSGLGGISTAPVYEFCLVCFRVLS